MARNVVCKKCNNLVNGWCEKVIDSPDQHIVRDCQYFREKTNADRIRSMSDEELKKFICSMFKCEFCDFELGERCGLLNWLQMPAEEVDNGKVN